MKKLRPIGKTAKAFLSTIAPSLLQSLGVAPVQTFLGLRVDILSEVNKRIAVMPEEQAEKALNLLKDIMNQWEP